VSLEKLSPRALFTPPLAIQASKPTLAATPNTPNEIKKETKLLNSIRRYVAYNIKRLVLLKKHGKFVYT